MKTQTAERSGIDILVGDNGSNLAVSRPLLEKDGSDFDLSSPSTVTTSRALPGHRMFDFRSSAGS